MITTNYMLFYHILVIFDTVIIRINMYAILTFRLRIFAVNEDLLYNLH